MMGTYQKIIVSFFILIFPLHLSADEKDSVRFNNYLQKFLEFEFNDTLKAIGFLTEATVIAEQNRNPKMLGIVYRYWGWYHQDHTRHFQAMEFFKKSMSYYFRMNDVQGMADSYGNIGNIYEDLGDGNTAIDYQLKSLTLNEKILYGEKDPVKYRKALEGKAFALGNISNLYSNTGDYEKSLDYAFRSIALEKKMGSDKSLDASYTNIGIIYRKMKQYEKSLMYHRKAFQWRLERNEIHNYGSSYQNLSTVLDEMGEPDSAMRYIDLAIESDLKSGNEWTLTFSYTKKAELLIEKGKYSEARDYAKAALIICQKNNIPGRSVFSHYLLYITNRNLNNYKEALYHHERHQFLIDSLNTAEAREMVIKKSMQHEFKMEKMTDSLETAQKEEETNAKHNAEIKQQQNYVYGAVGALSFLIVFAVVLYRGYRNKQKSNLVLEEKNKIIHRQKELVEEKNKEITDSINYAKRLQEAILPRLNDFKSEFKNSFILYLPKDIVAGDFYFFEKTDSHIFVAAADCTGHGVPGAMVSVVCSNALNRAVKEFKLTDPGEILDKVTDLVIETFEKSESEVKDGMDISLVVKEKSTNKFHWAGANNPLWIVSQVSGLESYESLESSDTISEIQLSQPAKPSQLSQLTEFKPDKQPIGRYESRKNFTTHSFETVPGDTIYIFTDGYADQFGGKHGKKFKQKKLKELLLEINSDEAGLQEQILKEAILSWKGDLEQNDDITIITIRM